MKIKKFLTKARWCQGEWAKDKNGNYCAVLSRKAVKFCLMGAVAKCYPGRTLAIGARLRDALGMCVTTFNDSPLTTFKEVKALVTRLDI